MKAKKISNWFKNLRGTFATITWMTKKEVVKTVLTVCIITVLFMIITFAYDSIFDLIFGQIVNFVNNPT